MDVWKLLFRLVLTDQLQCIPDLAQATLTQYIKLVDGHVFGNHHIELSSRKSLGREKCGREAMYRTVCDQDAPCVYTEIIGHILYSFSVAKDQLSGLVKLSDIHIPGSQPIDLPFGKPEDLSQFTDDRTVLKGDIGTQKTHVRKAIEDEADDVVPVGPGEIDIKVRWIGPIQIDEALKVEVQLYGVHVRDAHQVGHDAVGATPPPHIKISPAPGILDNAPVDQEIGNELFLPDDLQFLLQTRQHLLVRIGVTIAQVAIADVLHQTVIKRLIPSIALQVVVPVCPTEFKAHPATLEQRSCLIDQPGKFTELRAELVLGDEAIRSRGTLFFGQLAEQAVALNGPQQTMGVVVFLVPKAARVQKDHPLFGPIDPFHPQRTQIAEGDPYECILVAQDRCIC